MVGVAVGVGVAVAVAVGVAVAMISHLGQKLMSIDELRLPGDWPRILREPLVEKLAASHSYVGLIHPPVVRKSTKAVLAGRRSIAAHVARGEAQVLCDLVECDDDDCDVISLAENAVREHDEIRQTKDTANLVTKMADAILKAEGGSVRSVKAKARAEVAKATGISPEGIRKREQREAKRKEKAEAPPVDPIASPWVELDDEFKGKVAVVKRETEEIIRHLEQALSKTTKLRSSGDVHEDRLQRLAEDLQQLGNTARGLRPVSICFSCKGQEHAQKLCVVCAATGYVTKNQMAMAPPEMLDEANPKILFMGQVMTLTDYLLERYPATGDLEPEWSEDIAPEPEEVVDGSGFGLEDE